MLVFESPLHHDERGYFLENWRKKDLVANGVPDSFFHHKLQNNVSVSNQGVIRGMHCRGYEKLMTVAYGTFKMIFIDLRIDSPTYKSVDVIDVKPGRAVFVPGGVANGVQFVTVFVPDLNTLLEQNGKQIADTREWKVVSVDRTGFE